MIGSAWPFGLILYGLLIQQGVEADCSPSRLTMNYPNTMIPTQDRYRCETQSGGQFRTGCSIQLKCVATSTPPTYYFAEDKEGDGIKFTCNGNTWSSELGGSTPPPCLAGCVVLSSYDMENATYTQQPSNVYKNGDLLLWPVGSVIKTKCKEGYVFTDDALYKVGEDEHICQQRGYDDVINKKTMYGFPGKCWATCDPIDSRDIPSSVKITSNPLDNPNGYQVMNGVKKIRSDYGYTFNCKDGFKYPMPWAANNRQILTCKGGSILYMDTTAGKAKASPVACVANGCPAISSTNIDPNANVVLGTGCSSDSSGMMTESCSVTIQCNKNAPGLAYYMDKQPNGNKITCKQGQWVDSDGKNVTTSNTGKYGDSCIAGCPKLTSDEQAVTNIIRNPTTTPFSNGGTEIYPVGSTMSAACKDNYIRPATAVQPSGTDEYSCTSTGWKNAAPSQAGNDLPGKCIPACTIPTTTPTGTNIVVNGAKRLRNDVTYVQEGATVTVSCQDKYVPPPGSPTQQSLKCIGGTNGWTDTTTNTNNNPVMTCVRDGAVGCPAVTPESNPNTDVTKTGNCQITDNMVPPDCKISISCKEGYIPDASTPSAAQNQTLTCKAGHDGYVDDKNTANTQPLKCVPGCEYQPILKTTIYLTNPKPSDIIQYGNKQYVRVNTALEIKCKVDEGYVYNNNDDHIRGNDAITTYICRGGAERYIKKETSAFNRIPGDNCGGVCNGLESSMPDGTKATQMATTSSTFYYENGVMKVVNMPYTITCAKGFEFPKGSPEATRGKQNLICSGGKDGYVDIDTNKTNVQPTGCVRSEEPKCSAPTPDGSNTESVTSSGCAVSNNKVSIDCSTTIKCKKGYFPKDDGFGSTKSPQPLKCIIGADNLAQWVDSTTNKPVSPLICLAACSIIDSSAPNVEIINEPMPTKVGDDAYHKPGTVVTVKCKAGYIPRSDSGVKSSTSSMDYICNAGSIPDKPWMNKVAEKYEISPGSICVKSCPALQTNIPGLETISSPYIETTATGQIVTGGGTYVFACKKGYHYPDNSPYKANNAQQLYCGETSGVYLDLNGNNATKTAPENCIKDIGPGCPDLPVTDAQLDKSQCPNGYKDGCNIIIQCNKGFIPRDSQYFGNGKQELSCKDGNSWTNKKGDIVSAGMECQPACVADQSAISSTSTLSRNLTRVTVVNGVTYILPGEYVTFRCVGDSVLWSTDVSETKVTHEYQCVGGSDKQYKTTEGELVNTIGQGCVNTCSPLNIPTLIHVIMTPPKIISYEGKNYVFDTAVYQFQCEDKYSYPSGSTPSASGIEKIKCDGKTRNYINAMNGSPFNSLTQCIRKGNQNECPLYNQDSSTTITWPSSADKCKNDDGYVPTGCEIHVKCKQGFMPSDKAYFTPSGEQITTCGSGGLGWTDQFQNNIVAGLNCVVGCVNSTSISTSTASVSQVYERTIDGKKYIASCKASNSSVIVNGSNAYTCPASSNNSYFDSRCNNACKMFATAYPLGVIAFETPAQLDEETFYTFGTMSYIFKCSVGYTYSTTSKHRDSGRQTLTCNGKTNQYDDPDTNTFNATIEPCVEAKGCKQIDVQSTGINQPQGPNCVKNGDFYNDDCSLTYTCAKGFYPKDIDELYSGGQVLTCSEKRGGWINSKNLTQNKVLECIPGCAKINYTTVTTYINNTEGSVTERQVFDSQNGVHTCYDIESIQKIQKIITKAVTRTNNYFCTETTTTNSTEMTYNLENACKDSCATIANTSVPSSVQIKTMPPTYSPDDKLYFVSSGSKYTFTCKDGYEYDPTSKYKGSQILECQSNAEYKDLQTKAISKVIAPCRKIVGCGKIVDNIGVKVTYGDNCKDINSNVQTENCAATLSCDDDFYPTSSDLQTEAYQTLVCKSSLNIYKWIDLLQPNRNILTCTNGCLTSDRLVTNTSTIINQSIRKYPNNIVVYCNSSSVSKETLDKLAPSIGRYYCDYKNGSTKFENSSVLPCTNVCSKPNIDSTLDVIWPEPIFIVDDKYIVKSQNITVSCRDKDEKFTGTARNSAILRCVPESNSYEDKTDYAVGEKHVFDVQTKINQVKNTCSKIDSSSVREVRAATKRSLALDGAGGCKGIPFLTEYTNASTSCKLDKNDKLGVGCTMTIDCFMGSEIDGSTGLTNKKYECQSNGMWRNTQTNDEKIALDDHCSPPVLKTCAPFVYNETWQYFVPTFIDNDPDERCTSTYPREGCQYELTCKRGLTFDRGFPAIYKTKNVLCLNNSTYIDTKVNKITSPEEQCTYICGDVKSRKNVDVNITCQSYYRFDSKGSNIFMNGCILTATCKNGYIQMTRLNQTTTWYNCSDDSTLWQWYYNGAFALNTSVDDLHCIKSSPAKCTDVYLSQNVQIVTNCLDGSCTHKTKCKPGYEWDSATSQLNPYPEHYYICLRDGGFRDVTTNKTYPEIRDNCMPSYRYNCSIPQTSNNEKMEIICNKEDAICSANLQCRNGEVWDTESAKRNKNAAIHKYKCPLFDDSYPNYTMEYKWKDINNIVVTKIEDKCNPGCPIPESSKQISFVDIKCSSGTSNCFATTYCGLGYVSTSNKTVIVQSSLYECDRTTGQWKSNTNLVVTIEEMSTSCGSSPITTGCSNITVSERVNLITHCEKNNIACDYKLQCKQGYVWNEMTLKRNDRPKHMYICLGNQLYQDVDTNKNYTIIEDDCEITKSSCPTPNIDNNVLINSTCTTDALCIIFTRCPDGQSWDAESEKRNPDLIHQYKCQDDRKWLDIKTGQRFDQINDKCTPICDIGPIKNNTHTSVSCKQVANGIYECDLIINCGVRLFINSSTVVYDYVQNLVCNSTTKVWIDKNTNVQITPQDAIDKCGAIECDQFDLSNNNVELTTKCLPSFKGCSYYIVCKSGYVWSTSSYERNKLPEHYYICLGNRTYIDVDTNKTYYSITESCERTKSSCPTPFIKNNVLVTNNCLNTPNCNITTSCPAGQTWDAESEARDKAPIHTYQCQSDNRWKDLSTGTIVTVIQDKCTPICPLGPIKNKTHIIVNCSQIAAGGEYSCTLVINCGVSFLIGSNTTVVQSDQVLTCNSTTKTWIDKKTKVIITPQDAIDKCDAITTGCSNITVSERVNLITHCEKNNIACDYKLQCKQGYVWNEMTLKRNDRPKHMYICLGNQLYQDVDTNKNYTIIEDDCEITKSSCPTPNIDNNVLINSTCTTDALCIIFTRCPDGQSWDAESEKRNPDLIHQYKCQDDRKWLDIKTGQRFDQINDKCTPICDIGPIKNNTHTSVSCKQVANGIYECDLIINCGVRLFINSSTVVYDYVQNLVCNSTTKVWIDKNTNVQITPQDAIDKCGAIECDQFDLSNNNVELTTKCLPSFKGCSYYIVCKSGYVWSTSSYERNKLPEHYYICLGNRTYIDVDTNKTYYSITESCERTKSSCPTPFIKNNVLVTNNCLNTPNCNITTSCPAGQTWDAESEARDKAPIHTYQCQSDNRWKDLSTGTIVTVIQDKCTPICPLGPIKNKTHIIVNCSQIAAGGEYSCTLVINCGVSFLIGSNTTVVQSDQVLTCNSTTKTWIDKKTKVIITPQDAIDKCDAITTGCSNITVSERVNLITHCEKNNIACDYKLQCKQGYVWNEMTLKRNDRPKHMYICLGNQLYQDVDTNKNYTIIEDDCEITKSSCPTPNIDNNVLINSTCTMDALCTIFTRCPDGQSWDAESEKRNPDLIHQYKCQDDRKWLDIKTGQRFDQINDKCTPICDIGPIKNNTHTSVSCKQVANGIYECDLIINCGVRLFINSSTVVYDYVQNLVCNSTTKVWIDKNTNVQITPQDAIDKCGAPCGPLILATQRVKILKEQCLPGRIGCIYLITCQSGFEWNEATMNRNKRPKHSYVCLGDERYLDQDTNVTYLRIEDDCVPTKSQCPTPSLPNNVLSNSTCVIDPLCHIYTWCPPGQSWDTATSNIDSSTPHDYQCQTNKKWKNTKTGNEYAIIEDKCTPVCQIGPLDDNNTHIIVICTQITNTGAYDCQLIINCGIRQLLNGTTTVVEVNQNILCNDTTKQWIDKDTKIAISPQEALGNCPSPDDDKCGPVILSNRVIIDKYCVNKKSCDYRIRCISGYTWNEATMKRNSLSEHMYVCIGNQTFKDVDTNKITNKIEDDCVKTSGQCDYSYINNNLIYTTNCQSEKSDCLISISCPTGEVWNTMTALRNNNTNHTYQCQSDTKWKDVETGGIISKINDECQPACPIGTLHNNTHYKVNCTQLTGSSNSFICIMYIYCGVRFNNDTPPNVIEYTQELYCLGDSRQWMDRKTNQSIIPYEAERKCDIGCSYNPPPNVQLLSKPQCTSRTTACAITISCKPGYIWNDETYMRNPNPQHMYTCHSDHMFKDIATNKTYPYIHDDCIKPATKCIIPPLFNVQIWHNCTLSADCFMQLSCYPGQSWTNTTDNKNDLNHLYKCDNNDGQWINLKTNKKEITFTEQCSPPCELVISNTSHVDVFCEKLLLNNTRYRCDVQIACGVGIMVNTTMITYDILERTTCNEETKKWISYNTNSTVNTPFDLQSTCPAPCNPPQVTSNVDLHSNCEKNQVGCSFDLQCKKGYEWSESTKQRNDRLKHRYVCMGDDEFEDEDYQIYIKSIPDDCIKSSLCTLPSIDSDHYVLQNTSCKNQIENGCLLQQTCPTGMMWDNTTSSYNPELIHNYQCKDGQWIDTKTNKSVISFDDKCISVCPIGQLRNETKTTLTCNQYQFNSTRYACEVKIECGPGLWINTTNNATTTYKILSCDPKSLLWYDNTTDTKIIVTPLQIEETCVGNSSCSSPKPASSNVVVYSNCSTTCYYQLYCKAGFMWNKDSYSRNNQSIHLYKCSTGNVYEDDYTKKKYSVITDDCIPNPNCTLPTISPSVIVFNNTCPSSISCNIQLTCPEGNFWSATTTNNNETIHSYTCSNGSWKNNKTNEMITVFDESCTCVIGAKFNKTRFLSADCLIKLMNGTISTDCNLNRTCLSGSITNNNHYMIDVYELLSCSDAKVTNESFPFNSSIVNAFDADPKCSGAICSVPTTISDTLVVGSNFCGNGSSTQCTFTTTCKSGYVWDMRTRNRNNNSIHIWICLAQNRYQDVYTNATFSQIPDQCEKAKYQCNTPTLSSTVDSNTNCNGNECVINVSCRPGLDWDAESQARNANKTHIYSCNNNNKKWTDTWTNISYDNIVDNCIVIDCPIITMPTNFTNRTFCLFGGQGVKSPDSCVLIIYCGTGFTLLGKQNQTINSINFVCNSTTKVWIDTSTQIIYTPQSAYDKCYNNGTTIPRNCTIPPQSPGTIISQNCASPTFCVVNITCEAGYEIPDGTFDNERQITCSNGIWTYSTDSSQTNPQLCVISNKNCSNIANQPGLNTYYECMQASCKATFNCSSGSLQLLASSSLYTCKNSKWVNKSNVEIPMNFCTLRPCSDIKNNSTAIVSSTNCSEFSNLCSTIYKCPAGSTYTFGSSSETFICHMQYSNPPYWITIESRKNSSDIMASPCNPTQDTCESFDTSDVTLVFNNCTTNIVIGCNIIVKCPQDKMWIDNDTRSESFICQQNHTWTSLSTQKNYIKPILRQCITMPPSCAPIPFESSLSVITTCDLMDGRYKDGCNQTVQCAHGYINQLTNNTDQQMAICTNKQWQINGKIMPDPYCSDCIPREFQYKISTISVELDLNGQFVCDIKYDYGIRTFKTDLQPYNCPLDIQPAIILPLNETKCSVGCGPFVDDPSFSYIVKRYAIDDMTASSENTLYQAIDSNAEGLMYILNNSLIQVICKNKDEVLSISGLYNTTLVCDGNNNYHIISGGKQLSQPYTADQFVCGKDYSGTTPSPNPDGICPPITILSNMILFNTRLCSSNTIYDKINCQRQYQCDAGFTIKNKAGCPYTQVWMCGLDGKWNYVPLQGEPTPNNLPPNGQLYPCTND